MNDHYDERALDLLKCTHWGRELSETMRLLNGTWNAPVVDTDGLSDEYTPVQYLRILLAAAARDAVERPPVGDPMEPEELEYDLQSIKAFRTLAERGRQAATLADRIADLLQAPYDYDNTEDKDPDTEANPPHPNPTV